MSADKNDSDKKPMQTWSGRFSEPVGDLVKRYTASMEFDQRLADADIVSSLAHARMLTASGKFPWSQDLEDVHLNIEKRLIAIVGDAGKRLHTARSRNDQVATDLRMYVRTAIDDIVAGIAELRLRLLDLAEAHAATVMPGFTHLQVAQPVTFGHHLMAYEAMLTRDADRFLDCRKRVNVLPLGSAALAGTSYPIDRERVARELGFDGVCGNSLDAVSDRDFAIEFAAAASMLALHLSRFAEELVLWSSPPFAFVRISDRFCTGSSIMPQKRNPDVPELVRAKSGRIFGDLVALLTIMKGQPLAYNKDNQEDKEPVFDVVDTVLPTLAVMAELVGGGIEIDGERMRAATSEGFATATDLADYLVRKGLAFRDAHEAVALAVRHAEREQCDLAELRIDILQRFSPLIDRDVYAVLSLDGSVASRKHVGGTAPERVLAAIREARASLSPGK
ncbi:MAG: argininosuccinate lyase [Betaproteobacteria bacterium]|nr:MAG: argininosuccinate lyase [Betaproteobacteria bacterium]